MTELDHGQPGGVPPNPSTAMARAIVDELVRSGVTDAVLAPGSRSAALAIALDADTRIATHVQIDERSAAFVALGLARATSRPAAVVTTSGSAVANLHPAIVEADHGGVPLLLLTADRPPELRHTGANQTIDQPGIFGRSVRWSADIGAPEDRADAVALWRSTACRAVAESLGRAGRAGPVHLNLGFREPTVPASDDGRSPPATFSHQIDGRGDGRPWMVMTSPVPALTDADLEALADRLAVERGLILVGHVVELDSRGVPGRDAGHESGRADSAAALATAVERLAASTGWPILAEPTGRIRSVDGAVCGHHLLAHQDFVAAHRPDVVVRLGRSTLSVALEAALDPEVHQIAIGRDAGRDDPGRSIAQAVVADAAMTCAALAARLDGRCDPTSAWASSWQAAAAAVRGAIARTLEADDVITEPRIAHLLGGALTSEVRLVAASSMPIRDLDRYLPPGASAEVLANRGASGIDGTVSTILGVALADERPTVGVVGDLALLHDANGFLLRSERDADAVLVVVDNDGGGIFSFLPQARVTDGFERMFGTPHGRDIADLARFHGLGYTRVERASALAGEVTGALSAGGIHLVHVRTSRVDNVELHRRLDAAVRDAVDALG